MKYHSRFADIVCFWLFLSTKIKVCSDLMTFFISANDSLFQALIEYLEQ